MASDVASFSQDTEQPAIVTITVARNLYSPRFFGARPYVATVNSDVSISEEVIRVFANDSDSDVSINLSSDIS